MLLMPTFLLLNYSALIRKQISHTFITSFGNLRDVINSKRVGGRQSNYDNAEKCYEVVGLLLTIFS